MNDIVIDRQVDQISLTGNTEAVHDIKFSYPERRRDFIFNHLHFCPVANNMFAIFDRCNAPYIDANGGVKFQRPAAGGCFRVAKHNADFFANLVNKNHAGLGFTDNAGQFAHRLRHQARLQSHLRVAHFSFDFGFWHQCGNRVDHHDIQSAAAD